MNQNLLRKLALVALSLTAGGNASATPPPSDPFLHSAIRHPGESARNAERRYIERLRRGTHLDEEIPDRASAVAVPLTRLDLSKLPQWKAPFTMAKGFALVRDFRFLEDPKLPDFKRRSTWLYPDDGCFARASLMREKLEKWGAASPAKIFIFGNLTVKTPNAPSGMVSWWYHVVPIFALDQVPIVFDPAIEPRGPMRLIDWVRAMTHDPASVKLAICNPLTYSPSSSCGKPPIDDDKESRSSQIHYLAYEWDRVQELKMDPMKVLGRDPPWKHLPPRIPIDR